MSDSLDFSARVAPAPDTLMRELDGESVLLNLATEHYYGLNRVGTRMWQVLEASPSIEAAFETLRAEYDVEPDRLRQDLETLVRKLLEQGLVTLTT